MVELEIDGKKITAQEGEMIIEAADANGIYIPRFCYHKKLSIAANCRMCLIEVENVGKPLPACATPVTPDMKVFTKSDKALEAQRAVMEFLLINHPLDCPICDQGGECELQDLAMGYGNPYSYYDEGKRSVFDDDLGPLIDTNMTRCIQCTRCVRFGEEIAGMRELGLTYRGEHEQISTFIKHFVKSELSGNVIDLCPVGALTGKPYRYSYRSWEIQEHPMIAPHDCVGSNVFVHTRFQEYAPQRIVMRSVPRENESINENWLSDRDRFSYQGLSSSERIYKPKVKRNGVWHEIEWQAALNEVTDRIKIFIQEKGADQLATLAGASCTTEEYYLLQKMLRKLGGMHIDHRLRQQDFAHQGSQPVHPGLGMPIEELESQDAIVLIGSNVRLQQPILAHRINKATQEQATVSVINPVDYDFYFPVQHQMLQLDLVQALSEVAKAIADIKGQSVSNIQQVQASDVAKQIAQQLVDSQQSVLLLGEYALHHPNSSQLIVLANLINELCGATVAQLTDGANSAGAWMAGCVPHRGVGGDTIEQIGSHAKALLTSEPKQGYILFNVEPEYDSAHPSAALKTLQQAGLVICFATYVTEQMQQYADIILPLAPYTETQGTYVNVAGSRQTFAPVSVPMGDSKPGWKILRALASFLQLDGFNYENIDELRDELCSQMSNAELKPQSLPELHVESAQEQHIIRLAPWQIYCVDPLVRRADALQQTISDEDRSVSMNSALAQRLQLHAGDRVVAKQGDSEITLPVAINDRLVDNAVIIHSGLNETAGFGQVLMPVTLERDAQ